MQNNFASGPGLIIPSSTNRIKLEVGSLHGKVILSFNRPTDQLVLEPQHAAEIGRALAQAAMDIVKAGGIKTLLPEG